MYNSVLARGRILALLGHFCYYRRICDFGYSHDRWIRLLLIFESFEWLQILQTETAPTNGHFSPLLDALEAGGFFSAANS